MTIIPRTMWVRDASPEQIRDHLAECAEVCMADEVLVLRLDLQNEAVERGDDSEARYLGVSVDERVSNLHNGSIPVPGQVVAVAL